MVFGFLKGLFKRQEPSAAPDEDYEDEDTLEDMILDVADDIKQLKLRLARLEGGIGGRVKATKKEQDLEKQVHSQNGQYIVFTDGTFIRKGV